MNPKAGGGDPSCASCVTTVWPLRLGSVFGGILVRDPIHDAVSEAYAAELVPRACGPAAERQCRPDGDAVECMRRTRPFCARAATGRATEPPSSVMNARRPMKAVI
jgi:hypothetical protein